jgi:hypothetical protein
LLAVAAAAAAEEDAEAIADEALATATAFWASVRQETSLEGWTVSYETRFHQ